MSLESTAQELIVVDPSMGSLNGDHFDHPQTLEVIEVQSPLLNEHNEHEGHYDAHLSVHDHDDLEIVVDELPGAPAGTVDPEPVIEVVEEEQKAEDADSKKSKKNEKWDWESKGADGFVIWIKERIDGVPNHSGYDSAGLERAMAYLDRLDNEISRAMRLDLDGELDADKIEAVRSQIDEGISRLQQRLDKVKKTKKSNRKKKSENESITESMIKEAQKITGVQGVFVMADLLTSRIARVCINGMVSGGHDIEDIYQKQVDKYDLNIREQAQVMQLLSDMGYPLRQDRGYMPNEDADSTEGMDWSQNFKG